MQKLKSIICVVISIAFSISLAYLAYFKVFRVMVNDTCEKVANYQEVIYERYEKEIERMITTDEYTSDQYPMETKISLEDGNVTLVIKIGNYKSTKIYADYVTATIKNWGTAEQEITMERSISDIEMAYQKEAIYLRDMRILQGIYIVIFFFFTLYLVIKSIKREYYRVFAPMLYIIGLIVAFKLIIYLARHFLLK